jgi:formate hydrogenlyase subunit 3/multisubunit Na+/H+ antiporter MnhD subunit
MHSSYLFLFLLFWVELLLFVAFSSLDLFIFFISFEGITIQTFFLIYLFGSELTKFRASLMFLLCSLTSSAFITLGLASLYSSYRTSNIYALLIKMQICPNNITQLFLCNDIYLSTERLLFI